MKPREKGFATIEWLIAASLAALITGAAITSTFRVMSDTEHSNDLVTTVRQVENAAYWISRDAEVAENVVVNGLEPPHLVTMTFAEQHYNGTDPTFNSVDYYFRGLSGRIGELRRKHWSSGGVNEDTLIARYMYYDPGDPDGTSLAGYENPVITLRLTATLGKVTQTKEYMVRRRPNL